MANNCSEGKPSKKWTKQETQMILNYLQEFPELETPTARVYYGTFVEKSGIDATWDLVKCKVQDLKKSYKKAQDSLIRALTPEDIPLCANYKRLDEIFGEKTENDEPLDLSTNRVNPNIPSKAVAAMAPSSNCSARFQDESSIPFQNKLMKKMELLSAQLANLEAQLLQLNTDKRKDFMFMELLKTKREERKLKAQVEKENHEREMLFHNKKLDLEEQESRRESALSLLDLETHERLVNSQLAKEERVEKYHITMMYRYNNEQ